MPFHVPEAARNRTHPLFGSDSDAGNNGMFLLASPEPGWRLMLICSDSSEPDAVGFDRWEHVSVHAFKDGTREFVSKDRTPSWKEMCFVKDLCWDAEDVVMQLHPKRSEYVNQHPHTLHLWRPLDATIPTPPAIFVGERDAD
jgi:hypothetical protein